MTPDEFPELEPPYGSVVAIDWGERTQEVWVADRVNVGNWYSLEVPFDGSHHPTWYDVKHRAEGRTLTLLAPAPEDAYAAGFDAGVFKVSLAVEELTSELRLYKNGTYPEGGMGGV